MAKRYVIIKQNKTLNVGGSYSHRTGKVFSVSTFKSSMTSLLQAMHWNAHDLDPNRALEGAIVWEYDDQANTWTNLGDAREFYNRIA